MADRELSADELAEEIRRLSVGDLLVSTVSTLGQLAYVKLAANERDQARLAIDALGALLPTLEGQLDESVMRELKQLLASVRLAFASAPPAAPGGETEASADADEAGSGGRVEGDG